VINVLVADDHAVVREGIKRIIADVGDMAVIGEAANGPQLIGMVAERSCDVVLMDLAMPGNPGLEVLKNLREEHPALPVLVLSMHAVDQYAVRTLRAGASGYIHKGSPPDELIAAIRTVANGKRYITSVVAERLADHISATSSKPAHESLSNREFEVFRLIASGKTVSDIARALSISVKTVSTFRRRILEKLGFDHNAEIMRYAIEHHLID
jgi:two-component system invasion response regulator UvrY